MAESIKTFWGPQKLEDYNQTLAGKEFLETYTLTPKVLRSFVLLSPWNPLRSPNSESPAPQVLPVPPRPPRYPQRTPGRRNPRDLPTLESPRTAHRRDPDDTRTRIPPETPGSQSPLECPSGSQDSPEFPSPWVSGDPWMAEKPDPTGSLSGPFLYSAGSEPPGRSIPGILSPPCAPSPRRPVPPLPGPPAGRRRCGTRGLCEDDAGNARK